ncbi:uncharacterized protein AC631_04360 [Debaryomyces fabryi]|uniref:Zn(2)-C6 fungal-type domain-containing protein n=1 Tax=Debaryomyces fabryi TaxID=58627 RepID=A0A0V1PUF9_9ASCO|nr:uncharacterized protein AC631_04360 [Debaryomyces fabryi]KRZ99879.1 hypothetical protein AC631_04360 [Debaryomyces fabryi]CUM46702.1 unnamed protein product [Debaryomyces fabryi]
MDPWYTEEGADSESNREPDVNVPPNVPIYQQFMPSGDANMVQPIPLGISSADAIQSTALQSMPIQGPLLIPSHIDQLGEGNSAPYSAPLHNETEVQPQKYHHIITGLSQIPSTYIRQETFAHLAIANNPQAIESNMMVPNLDTNPHAPQQPKHGTNVSSALAKKTSRRSSRSSESHHGSPTDESSETHITKTIAKRSRMGCLTCRQRKKRCCEKRPQCTECLRLGLDCIWPVPGTEHRNKSRESRDDKNTIEHEAYGKIKVLRGIVEYKSK